MPSIDQEDTGGIASLVAIVDPAGSKFVTDLATILESRTVGFEYLTNK